MSIQIKRGLSSAWDRLGSTVRLDEGQLAVSLDEGLLKVGPLGGDVWENSVPIVPPGYVFNAEGNIELLGKWTLDRNGLMANESTDLKIGFSDGNSKSAVELGLSQQGDLSVNFLQEFQGSNHGSLGKPGWAFNTSYISTNFTTNLVVVPDNGENKGHGEWTTGGDTTRYTASIDEFGQLIVSANGSSLGDSYKVKFDVPVELVIDDGIVE